MYNSKYDFSIIQNTNYIKRGEQLRMLEIEKSCIQMLEILEEVETRREGQKRPPRASRARG